MTLIAIVLSAPPMAVAGPNADVKAKASKWIPSQYSDIQRQPPLDNPPAARARSSTGAAVARDTTDTTPPTVPANLVARAAQLSAITASWSPAQDPESGILDYVFAIGTHATAADGPLDDVHGWQVTYDTSISVSLSLDPNVTYYVSIAAVNNAMLYSAPVTSAAIHPVWQPIGQPGNVLALAFSSTGYDASGNPTTGWTADQITAMQTFFNRIYPILVNLYGPPSVSYTVTAVRDLRYTNSDIFIPSTLEIRMSDTFNPQLFTHELTHAFRGTFILSSDQNWNFDPTLSGFEEGFAQAVSYEAMNAYVAQYPNDTLVPGNSLWDSSYEWDYDFQNVAELRGTDFWSTYGAAGILWLKYEMAAAAMRKINLESPGFYQAFNKEYYRRINANPATRPSRALLVDIVKTVVPTIEGMAADAWIDKQLILYCQLVFGEKIFYNIQDYPATDLYSFDYIHFWNTMSCGSEWACYDGTQWVYYGLNGSLGTGTLTDWTGATVWSGGLQILPAQNPSDGYYGFGSDAKHLTTAASQLPWPGGSADDFVFNVDAFGLYKFASTFTDAATGQATTNSFYRPFGTPIANNFQGAWGGVVGRLTGTIYLDHDGLAPEAGLPVVNGVFAGPRSWTGIANARTGARDSLPGKVYVTFVDGVTGETYRTQRNISYGNWNGSQMFLFDFGASAPVPPSVSLTAPSNGALVTGVVPLAATATSSAGISRVQFYQGAGVLIGTATATPYTVNWNTAGLAQGVSYALYATAFDTSGVSGTSASVPVMLKDTTTPSVSLTSPAAGASVNGSVTLAAAASDNVGVVRTEFYVDGALLASVTSAPYKTVWNTSAAAAGSHTLTAKAYDQANNSASAAVSVVKDATKPTISFTAPAANASVSGMVAISATASDNVAVAKVEFYVDGALVATDTATPYSTSWNADAAALGSHSLSAIAYDQAGNTTTATRSVTVVDKAKPVVSITQPANSAQVSRSTTVTIAATASDNRSIAKVEFYVNNVLKCTDTQSPYTCNWAVPSQRNASYTLRARAYDGSNNTTDATATVTAR